MAQIINNTGINFSSEAIAEINKNAEHHNSDTVYAAKNATDSGNDTLFDFYDEDSNYLFSLDLEDNVVWSK